MKKRSIEVFAFISVCLSCSYERIIDTQAAEEICMPLFISPFPMADGFDFPVNPPEGNGYYNAQGFGKNAHLGDDWNGKGGGNTDFDDPVYSIGCGVVTLAGYEGPGWGNVVRVEHRFYRDSVEKHVESLYAHLHLIDVSIGDTLSRGEKLGTIGNADGAYYAHLHLEIRNQIGLALGGGYGENRLGHYIDPTAFKMLNRPKVR